MRATIKRTAKGLREVVLVLLCIAIALLFWPVLYSIVESVFRGDWTR